MIQFIKNKLFPQKNYVTYGYVQDIFKSVFDGDKFPGSFGRTKDYEYVDYYELRKRSAATVSAIAAATAAAG